MTKTVTISFFLLLLFSFGCKKNPTYNPFDQVFDISVKQVTKNGCDTISAGCGYYNLTERNTSSKMHYQIYSKEFFEVVAKGYLYHIDTFQFESRQDFYQRRKAISDSLFRLPFDSNKLDQYIQKYNYYYLDRDDGSVRILNPVNKDTVELNITVWDLEHAGFFVRNLQYFKGNPKTREKEILELHRRSNTILPFDH